MQPQVNTAASETQPGQPPAPPLDAIAVETLRGPASLTWIGTRACNGHLHTLLDEFGRVLSRAWYGYTPRCGCRECRRETLTRRLRRVDGHGGLGPSLHFVATAPPEADIRRLDRLKQAKSAAMRCAQQATEDVLGVVEARNVCALAVVHPQGDRAGVARPHVDGWITGPGLDRLSDPLIEAAWWWCFRRRWSKAVRRISGRQVRTPQVAARWYGDAERARWALRDTLRAMPGWNIATRISIAGPWKKIDAKRERGPTAFPAGTIPYETVRRAAWSLLTEEERDYYRVRVREEARATSLRPGVEMPLPEWIVPGAMKIPASTPDEIAALSAPRVARQVADFDNRLLVPMIRLREEMRTAREIPGVVIDEIAALQRVVERRRTPSSELQASWLRDALRFDLGTKLSKPPSGVSGLIAGSELTYLRSMLRARLEAEGRLEALDEKRRARRLSRTSERLEVV